jgi:hypothetical protein
MISKIGKVILLLKKEYISPLAFSLAREASSMSEFVNHLDLNNCTSSR